MIRFLASQVDGVVCTGHVQQEEERAGLPCYLCVLSSEFVKENCGLGHESVAMTEVARHAGFSVFGHV